MRAIYFPSFKQFVPEQFKPWLCWGLGLCFTLVQFFMQLATGHMANSLMRDFQLDAVGLSSLSSAFFYTFILFMLPGGLLLDRFGINRVLTWAIAALSLGCFLFASSHGLPQAYFGRLLMGLGSSMGFVGMLALVAPWFPSHRFVMIVAYSEMIGMLAVSLSQMLLPGLLEAFGWRMVIGACGSITLVLAVLFITVLPDPPAAETQIIQQRPVFRSFVSLCASAQAWANGLCSGLMSVVLTVFEALWGVPFLMSLYHMSLTQAGMAVGLVLLGIAAGSPLVCMVSNKINRKKPVLLGCILLQFLILMLLIYAPIKNVYMVLSLCFGLGVFNSAYILSFSIAKETAPQGTQNAAMAFTNMVTMSGAVVIQPIIGYLLYLNQFDRIVNGVVQYSAQDYRMAFSVLPVCLLLAFWVGLQIREERAVGAVASAVEVS